MFTTSIFTSSYADHGGGTAGSGGGCSGDCTSPTLGFDEQGKSIIKGGLTINSQSFDVEQYSQTIPTQILKTDEKNMISLKIYEDTSPEYLSHVELHFNTHDRVTGGVTVEDPTVSIVWDDTGGEVLYGVYGDEEMITNVSIDQTIEDNLALVAFEFEFTKPLDVSTLMIKTWDEERNPSKNYFYEAITVMDELRLADDTIPLVPTWVKNNAGWWAEDEIDDDTFVQGLQFLIQQEILEIPVMTQTPSENMSESDEIPEWVKNNAGWWADDLISESDFLHGIQFLIQNEVIRV